MMFGSVPTKFRFGSCGSFSFAGSMTSRFVPVRVCRFVSVRGHTVEVSRNPPTIGSAHDLNLLNLFVIPQSFKRFNYLILLNLLIPQSFNSFKNLIPLNRLFPQSFKRFKYLTLLNL